MTAMEAADMYVTINFEETELRLGLPASKGELQQQAAEALVVLGKNAAGKRGFSETVDLKLNLSSSTKMDGRDHHDEAPMNTRNYDHDNMMNNEKLSSTAAAAAAADSCSNNDPAKPPAKAQVVGWPPIRSFRKNVMAVQKSNDGEASKKSPAATVQSAAFVKVSMDGAPYLRKVDLKLYKSYDQLSQALAKMFSSFTTENRGPSGMKDFMNESKLVDILNGSKYVPSYEDQDGDWMLVGDVPWEMFVESCKRLRIMKGSEATGLAPRAVEKCKSRS